MSDYIVTIEAAGGNWHTERVRAETMRDAHHAAHELLSVRDGARIIDVIYSATRTAHDYSALNYPL